jgi:hypothetical protein
VFEDKDEEGKINNNFDTKAFNLNGVFYFNQVEALHGPQMFHKV